MKLTVHEVAAALGSDDDHVYDWIEGSDLPAQRISGQYWINRAELLEWATQRNIAIAPGAFSRQDEPGVPSFAEALRAGGIFHRIEGGDVPAVMRAIVSLLPLDDEEDREMLLHFVLAKESLGLAAIGDGIAIPHVRMPIILAPSGSIAALAFLLEPLKLKSPDGKPVDTLFFLVCPTVHAHLAMLAKLAYCLKTESFREILRQRATSEEILRLAASIEGAA